MNSTKALTCGDWNPLAAMASSACVVFSFERVSKRNAASRFLDVFLA